MNGSSSSEDWLAQLEVFGMNQLSMQGHPIHIKVTTPAQLMQGQGIEKISISRIHHGKYAIKVLALLGSYYCGDDCYKMLMATVRILAHKFACQSQYLK